MCREWNSAAYHRLATPQLSWGRKVLQRVELRGDETLLDAGCGSGGLTGELLQSLARGRLIAVDLSENMLLTARQNLVGNFGEHVRFVACDLISLPFTSCFDGIFSTAVFHWVLDHDALFRSIRQALRPGGWLIAQCGGGPNLRRLRDRVREVADTAPYAAFLRRYPEPWFFSEAPAAAERLRRAGFVKVETSLEPAPIVLEDAEHYREFVRDIILHRHLERLPHPAMRDQFITELTRRAASDDPPYALDYWRLNLRGELPV